MAMEKSKRLHRAQRGEGGEMSKRTKPDLNAPPGSDGAIAAGCRCPVLDNEHGRGFMGQEGVYCHSGDCPIHGHIVAEAIARSRAEEGEVD